MQKQLNALRAAIALLRSNPNAYAPDVGPALVKILVADLEILSATLERKTKS